MEPHRVLERIERDFGGPHLDRVLRYLAQPSVSALGWGVQEMAELLAEDIRALGGTADVVETAELPVVFGRVGYGAAKTLLFHGLYDVTPADEPEWATPPFEPQIRQIEGIGRCVIGRGAEDMKTPIAAAMNVIASFRACREPLPVDVIFVLEASELGSGGIREFVPRYAEELRQADLVHWLCPMAHPGGEPIVPLALKGNLMGRLVCRGGEWGGPIANELHALHSTWVGNPATRLAGAIAHLERTLEEAYKRGEGWQPSESQRALTRTLAQGLDPEEMRRTLGVRRLRYDRFQDALEAHLFSPQFTVTGLQSGFVGEGKSVKVSIPAEAQAVVNMRFQPGERPEDGVGRIRDILDEGGYGDILFEVSNSYAGGGTPLEHPAVGSFLAAFAGIGWHPEVWPVHPTGMPVALWTEVLRLPWVGGVPCHANGKHAANEYAHVDGILASERFLAYWMTHLARSDLTRNTDGLSA